MELRPEQRKRTPTKETGFVFLSEQQYVTCYYNMV